MSILMVIFGLALAIYGAQLLVKGGVSISQRLKISTLIVGVIVVGFGSSAPELTVNITSALNGSTDLALGNVLGSNLFNICIITGIVSLICPLFVNKASAAKDLPMCLLSALMIGVCGNEIYFDSIDYHELFPSHGIIFLCFFAIFMYYTLLSPQEEGASELEVEGAEGEGKQKNLSLFKASAFVVAGLVGLVLGGDLIIDGAEAVAERFGLSERIIGLMIVGPGTSLPELIASIVAARNNAVALVIGNVLGSCIFNVFAILGITSLIKPVPLDLSLNYVVLFNFMAVMLLFLAVWLNPRRKITRPVGIFLISLYSAYIVHSLTV